MNLPAPEIIAPKVCIGCKTDIETLNTESGGFITFPAFNLIQSPQGSAVGMIYGMAFHCCPKCGAVMINTNAVDNMRKFNDAKLETIIKPQSRLII